MIPYKLGENRKFHCNFPFTGSSLPVMKIYIISWAGEPEVIFKSFFFSFHLPHYSVPFHASIFWQSLESAHMADSRSVSASSSFAWAGKSSLQACRAFLIPCEIAMRLWCNNVVPYSQQDDVRTLSSPCIWYTPFHDWWMIMIKTTIIMMMMGRWWWWWWLLKAHTLSTLLIFHLKCNKIILLLYEHTKNEK